MACRSGVHDPTTKTCVAPFHDVYDINGGGPHGEPDASGRREQGQDERLHRIRRKGEWDLHQSRLTPRVNRQSRTMNGRLPDVMGYHTAAEIPNYWTYASQFTLDDHMFEPVKSWSLPDHLFMVSGWSANCKSKKASSCQNDILGPYGLSQFDNAVARSWLEGRPTSTWPGPT